MEVVGMVKRTFPVEVAGTPPWLQVEREESKPSPLYLLFLEPDEVPLQAGDTMLLAEGRVDTMEVASNTREDIHLSGLLPRPQVVFLLPPFARLPLRFPPASPLAHLAPQHSWAR